MKSVGYMLKKVRRDLSWSQERLGNAVGVSKQQIGKWEDADDNLKVVTVKKLCATMGVDPALVFTGESSPYHAAPLDRKGDFYYFPQYDVQASAGDGAVVDSEKLIGYLAFDKGWVNTSLSAQPKDLVLIKAMGDSMEPTFNDGDLLLLDSNNTGKGRSDGIYAFYLDSHLSVKRFQWLIDGGLSIISDNPSYKTMNLSKPKVKEIFIIGRVVWFGQKL